MRFNTLLKRAIGGNTTNLAGGRAFTRSPKDELVSILLTATLDDQFYRSGDATAARLKELIASTDDKAFAAKAAIYARTKAGMRSGSHLVAAELARAVKGAPWTRRFYDRVVHRPDDALELLASRKLGYFALLRNLRNILEQAPQGVDAALAMLVDKRLIAKSLVLPFRYLTALEAVQSSHLPRAGDVLAALSDAADKALANVPRFEGRTLVALDGSGSMNGRPLAIGALFAAVLAKANAGATVMVFSNDAEFVALNRRDSTLTLARQIAGRAPKGGTNFHAIFQRAKSAYERIVILSDMQGWIGQDAPTATFAAYKQRTAADPRVFSFDLAGYGTLQFPERNVFCLTGFSDKALQTMRFLEEDKGALLREIEAIEL